jgi:hypothetical protein
MRQLHIRREWGIALGLGLLFAAAASYGQSLGDVARQQRQKQQSKSAQAPRKVITNEDIPESPASSQASASASTDSDKRDQPSATPSSGDVMRAGEQFKAQIRAQKNSIASLQKQIDKLNSTIHFVEANRYRNGVQYNQLQIQKQEEAQRMQRQLDEAKNQLEQMQEAARKAGFGNAVYDPE